MRFTYLLSAFSLFLSGCIVNHGEPSFEHWLESLVNYGDVIVCASNYESDYFAVVRDDHGLRLDQSIAIGLRGQQPSDYIRSVSFLGPEQGPLGQYGHVQENYRRTVERGRFIYSDRSDYYPIDLSAVALDTIVVEIAILKGEASSRVEKSSGMGDKDFDYTVICTSDML